LFLRREAGTLRKISFGWERSGHGFTVEERANGRFSQDIAAKATAYKLARDAAKDAFAADFKASAVVALADCKFNPAAVSARLN
jgi:hypothetical protein